MIRPPMEDIEGPAWLGVIKEQTDQLHVGRLPHACLVAPFFRWQVPLHRGCEPFNLHGLQVALQVEASERPIDLNRVSQSSAIDHQSLT